MNENQNPTAKSRWQSHGKKKANKPDINSHPWAYENKNTTQITHGAAMGS
jgi:hypothetical protein